jgi:WD40 repeat protein
VAPPPESSREAVERERPGHSREADPGHVATRLPFDPAFVAASLPNGDVRRYASWRQAGQTAIGKGYLYFLEAFNAGRWLIVKSAYDVSVRILDAKTHAQLFSWPVQNLAADEAHVVLPWTGGGPPQVLVGKSDGLWIYAADSGHVVSQLSDTPTTSARWSRDGSLLMTSEAAIPEQTSRFRIYQRQPTDTLTLLSELAVSERVDGWDLSRDNRFLARNFYPSERTTVLDLATGQTVLDVPSPRYAGSVEFSPDGRWLAMGGSGVKWLDVSNPTRRTEYTYFYNNVADVEFSPSGDVLVATSYDGSVRLLAYDEPANRLELVTTFRHQINTNVYAARFLEQGNLLVTSAGDRTVRYWSGKNGAADSPTDTRWRDPFSWLSWGA